MITKHFWSTFLDHEKDIAIVWNDNTYTYELLLEKIVYWLSKLQDYNISKGDKVALEGDFSPNTISLLFTLIENRNIIIPLNRGRNHGKELYTCNANKVILVDKNDNVSFHEQDGNLSNKYYDHLHSLDHPGLILFTSGSSGKPKAAVHDFVKLLDKFKKPRTALRTLNFLLFDHWGGLNTMFHTLANSGTLVTINDRKPSSVCSLIEKYKVELLPTSPTFLKLLLLGEQWNEHDLSSLKVITYGTEPMPQTVLDDLKIVFPNVKLQQTYGLIELGVLHSKSESNDSLWVKIGGDGYQTRIVNGLLEIKADSAMLGYLNASSPFTPDGWFKTGDMVEVKGEYFRILGRQSELINVGGEKVHPSEIENVIMDMGNVVDVLVYGEKNDVLGNIVCSDVKLIHYEPDFQVRLKKHCREQLSPFKIPMKINIVDKIRVNERFKKVRYGNER